ncbi:phosphoribosyltransferase family protein [Vibrio proteolyticus]
MLSHWWQNAMLCLGGAQCDLCRLSADNRLWCRHCQRYFAPRPRCQRCGLPTPIPVEQCGQCLASPPLWNRLYCIGDYQPPLSEYVHRFKYRRQFWLSPPLAQLLTPQIETPAPLLTSVPLHWRRHAWRGFNQSELLAVQLIRQWPHSRYQPLFQRCRATVQQQGLSKAERSRNLRRAFVLSRAPSVRHVALVDDVVTTGSTVQQLCKLLLDAGAETVDIYCLCRTPEPGD